MIAATDSAKLPIIPSPWVMAVSYTHLDVYKRQFYISAGTSQASEARVLHCTCPNPDCHPAAPVHMGKMCIRDRVIFAAVAALVSELIVGVSAMHSGWFPGFATALLFLIIGMMLGFPTLPLAILAGFTAATGPAFSDMGNDLKAGWILRGKGADPELEKEGRKQQY